MASFSKSDYTVNKYSKGIVYLFADHAIEITLEDYLSENPSNTEEDFQELKILSDSLYRREMLDTYNQCRLNLSMCGMDRQTDPSPLPEDGFINALDKQYSLNALKQLLNSGELTDIQRRRFLLYIGEGLSLREIAAQEGRSHLPVYRSINSAFNKLKKYFAQQG